MEAIDNVERVGGTVVFDDGAASSGQSGCPAKSLQYHRVQDASCNELWDLDRVDKQSREFKSHVD